MALFKNKIKYIRSLQRKKFRQKYNNFVVEGDKMVCEILARGQLEIEAIYALESWLTAHQSLLSREVVNIFSVSPLELSQISSLTTPNQVLLVVKKPEQKIDPKFTKGQLLLYLDDIRDPGNMGTILRIADWFAVPYVVLSSGCVDVFSHKVVQASMGALQRVACPEMTLEDLAQLAPDLPIYGTSMEGENLFALRPERGKGGIIVIGNEGKGIAADNRKFIKSWLSIPRAEGGGAESLNAAVATGIICAFWKNKVI